MFNFSVLISVYYKDNPDYLIQALNSIINQTLLPDEIVCIKDGKLTDELNQIIDDFQKNNITTFKVLQLQTNTGLANALNQGLVHCSYNWIARMDSDDISEINRFELMREFILMNPQLDVVGSQIIEFSSNNSRVFKRNVFLKHEDIINDLIYRCPMNHVTVFYKKESVIKSGLYRKVLLEDYDLWIRMYLSGFKFGNTEKYLVKVRADIDLMSRRSGINYFKGEYRIQQLLRSNKIIGNFRFIINIIKRGLIRFLPNLLLRKIYLFTRK